MPIILLPNGRRVMWSRLTYTVEKAKAKMKACKAEMRKEKAKMAEKARKMAEKAGKAGKRNKP